MARTAKKTAQRKSTATRRATPRTRGKTSETDKAGTVKKRNLAAKAASSAKTAKPARNSKAKVVKPKTVNRAVRKTPATAPKLKAAEAIQLAERQEKALLRVRTQVKSLKTDLAQSVARIAELEAENTKLQAKLAKAEAAAVASEAAQTRRPRGKVAPAKGRKEKTTEQAVPQAEEPPTPAPVENPLPPEDEAVTDSGMTGA